MLSPSELDAALRLLPRPCFDLRGDNRQALGLDLPIAVINLDRRPDRWQAVSSRMASVGLDKLTRVSAVEGARLDLDAMAPLLAQSKERVENAPRDHFTLTRPAIGCYLSHLAIWQHIIEHDVPRVLVLEDDASPIRGADAAGFRAAVEGLTPDHGLVLPGRIIMHGMAEAPAAGAALARIYYYTGTFAYMITPTAARFLTARLLPMDGHIDHQISAALIAGRHEIAAWYIEPPFLEPDWSLRSDIYIPLENETEADRQMAALLEANRQLLLDEGRPLVAPLV